MDLPVNVSTGMVVGRYIADVIDGPDVNLDPDALPVQGRIVFTASVPYLPNPTAGPDPVTIMRVPIVGVLDQEGYLCTPYPGTLEPQYRGVRLIATDDPDISVTDWTWDVTYLFEPVNGHKLAIPAHGFALPSDGTVDLTKVAKVPSSPGYSLPQAEAAVLRAEEAALTSAQDAANALAAALRSEQAAAATDQGITDMLSDPDTQSGGLLAEMLDLKANADDVAMALADKAGRGEVESLVASKADAAETTEALGGKADLQAGKVPIAQLPTDALVTDANVAAVVDGAQTGPAIDQRINTQVAPQVQQITSDYIASQPAVVDAAAAAVDANPKIAELEASKWFRRNLTEGEVLAELSEDGLYKAAFFGVAQSIPDRPSQITSEFELEHVTVAPSAGIARQTIRMKISGRPSYREQTRYVVNQVPTDWAPGIAPVSLEAGTNLSTLVEPGTYEAPIVTVGDSLVDRPPNFTGQPQLYIVRRSGNTIFQEGLCWSPGGIVLHAERVSSGGVLGAWAVDSAPVELKIGDDLNSFVDDVELKSSTVTVGNSLLNRPPNFSGQSQTYTVRRVGPTIFQKGRCWSPGGIVLHAERVSSGGVLGAWTVPEEPPAELDDTKIAILGDSQSAPTATSWDKSAGPLLTDSTFVNLARSGDNSQALFLRTGIIQPKFRIVGGSIPASGAVGVTTSMKLTLADGLAATGRINGIAGTLTSTGGLLTFTRSTAGVAVPAAGWQQWESSIANTAKYAILWVGGNDFNQGNMGQERNTADHIIGMYRLFVETCLREGRIPIVAGVTNRGSALSGSEGFAQVQRINRTLRLLYPDFYLEVQAYYVEHAIYDAGLTPTQADLDAIARGEIPPQLFVDNVHLLPAVHEAIGSKWIAPWLAAKGYAYTTNELTELPVLNPADMEAADSSLVFDETAGRTVKAWDYLNQREQVIYGDTGERNITALSGNVASGNIYIQRTDNEVTITLLQVKLAALGEGSATDLFAPGAIPAGFRHRRTTWYPVKSSGATATGEEWRQFGVTSSGWMPIYSGATLADEYRAVIKYTTSDPWPTSLPGVAA